MRIPEHIGIIPDGNRRWAESQGLTKEKGYYLGLDPGVETFRLCKENGIKEISYYGFTTDNTKRPSVQKEAFTEACVKAVELIAKEDAEILVLGNTESKVFPKELEKYTERQITGKGGIKVNFLINYGWSWDLNNIKDVGRNNKNVNNYLRSYDISRIDLIIRWGGRRRLSGFLPVQSVYADFFVVDDYWPDFKREHFSSALDWYRDQDITLGG